MHIQYVIGHGRDAYEVYHYIKLLIIILSYTPIKNVVLKAMKLL